MSSDETQDDLKFLEASKARNLMSVNELRRAKVHLAANFMQSRLEETEKKSLDTLQDRKETLRARGDLNQSCHLVKLRLSHYF